MFRTVPYATHENQFEKLYGRSSGIEDRCPMEDKCPMFETNTLTISPKDSQVKISKKIEAKDLFPKVSRVVFNDPVTKVWFDDGTTSLVRCSKTDSFSKDAGLAFALIKRLFGTIDDRNRACSDGYMCELSRIIKKAYDQKAAEKKSEKKDPPGKPQGKPAKNPKGAKKNSGKKSS